MVTMDGAEPRGKGGRRYKERREKFKRKEAVRPIKMAARSLSLW
jgi:hypothetical protein